MNWIRFVLCFALICGIGICAGIPSSPENAMKTNNTSTNPIKSVSLGNTTEKEATLPKSGEGNVPKTEDHAVAKTTNAKLAVPSTPMKTSNDTSIITNPSSVSEPSSTSKDSTTAPPSTTTSSTSTTIPPDPSTTPSNGTTSTTPTAPTTPPKPPTKTPTTKTISTTVQPPTTVSPNVSTTTQKPKPVPCERFDGPSFIGGIVLTMGLSAIAFIAYKFLKARNERNYHTL